MLPPVCPAFRKFVATVIGYHFDCGVIGDMLITVNGFCIMNGNAMRNFPGFMIGIFASVLPLSVAVSVAPASAQAVTDGNGNFSLSGGPVPGDQGEPVGSGEGVTSASDMLDALKGAFDAAMTFAGMLALERSPSAGGLNGVSSQHPVISSVGRPAIQSRRSESWSGGGGQGSVGTRGEGHALTGGAHTPTVSSHTPTVSSHTPTVSVTPSVHTH